MHICMTLREQRLEVELQDSFVVHCAAKKVCAYAQLGYFFVFVFGSPSGGCGGKKKLNNKYAVIRLGETQGMYVGEDDPLR